MSPVAGLVRERKHQFGRQTTHGTAVAAKRAYPLKGVPDPNLGWTDPDVDVGSIDLVVAPHREAPNLTAALTDPSLRYNNLPLILCGFFGGDVDPSGAGTAQTWAHAPASTSPLDEFDRLTYEFGDDVLTDWYQFLDGIIENFEIVGPESLGVLTASHNWRFGRVNSTGSTDAPASGTVPTPGLSVPTDDVPIYLKDGGIYIAEDPYDLEANLIGSAFHSFRLRGTQEVDQKRWADGDQSFDVDEYGRGRRMIELECTFAKTSDTVGVGSLSDAWMSDEAVNKYVGIIFESQKEAQAGIPYAWDVRMPLRYYTRQEGEIGNNTIIRLTGRAFLDADMFGGVLTSQLINTLPAANF